ncbi:glucosidase II beta subunit-like protein-domain-containing protein [Lipomyces arxii]|uniref:glucosidase II beta subunit-like protein-domain-containing protein n=1 Tax=Lipomyces arxii TaxID=56418 RepID=UPI0034CEA633
MRVLVIFCILIVQVRALFSVQDDLLAFPQFQISLSNEFMSENEAFVMMSEQAERYEKMSLEGSQFLCEIPVLEPVSAMNASQKEISRTEEEKELMRARASGWDLLEPLNGTCLYYIAGWWTYSFCHKVGVKQFHQLAPQNGATLYPPKEDPQSESYTLGRMRTDDKAEDAIGEETSVQSAGEMRYLVQKVGGGSVCDLTGRERRIEIQFHCNQNSNDKIAWIKEVTTCRYLMVIHTPRLCLDAAFLPPNEGRANEIKCRLVLSEDEIASRLERSRLDAMIMTAMIDHDIDEPVIATGTGTATTLEIDETSTTTSTHPADETFSVVDLEDTVSRPVQQKPRRSLDLVTSANMLVRDIERQIAVGAFLSPDGKIASADDEFAYSVALVDVNGQVIGVVTVVVKNGKVQVELEEGQSKGAKQDFKTKIPYKLKQELREFSGGDADLDEITQQTAEPLWNDDDDKDENDIGPAQSTQYRIVRDEL